jgi:hypothetical protein
MQPIGWSATSVPELTPARYGEVLAELAEALVAVASGRAGQSSRPGPVPQRAGLLLWLWSPDPGGPVGAGAGPDLCAGCAQPFEPDDPR